MFAACILTQWSIASTSLYDIVADILNNKQRPPIELQADVILRNLSCWLNVHGKLRNTNEKLEKALSIYTKSQGLEKSYPYFLKVQLSHSGGAIRSESPVKLEPKFENNIRSDTPPPVSVSPVPQSFLPTQILTPIPKSLYEKPSIPLILNPATIGIPIKDVHSSWYNLTAKSTNQIKSSLKYSSDKIQKDEKHKKKNESNEEDEEGPFQQRKRVKKKILDSDETE